MKREAQHRGSIGPGDATSHPLYRAGRGWPGADGDSQKMQMYRVRFARKLDDAKVDVGDVVVCAGTQEMALVLVAQILDLPVSGTEFEVARVKPSFFQVSRRTVDHRLATFAADTVSDKVACRATFPGVTESRVERDWYQVHAQADIHAENENEAILMLSRSLVREVAGENQKRSTQNLDVACDRRAVHPRTAAVEENGLYRTIRVFQGGDART